jgi:hypothetical protein
MEDSKRQRDEGRQHAPKIKGGNEGALGDWRNSKSPAHLQGKEMNEAREKFEAILMTKGKRAPGWDGEKYDNINIQTYWRWFLLGWTTKTNKESK